MLRKWQLQEAKNKFSELVEKAIGEGPQIVTKHGEDSVAILSILDFRKLVGPKNSLVEFFAKSPFKGLDLDSSRQKDLGRKVDL